MQVFLSQLTLGLVNGSFYAMLSLGLAVIFGLLGIVNFAHGALYMLGAYVAFTLTERFSGAVGFWAGIVAASLIVAALGVLVEHLERSLVLAGLHESIGEAGDGCQIVVHGQQLVGGGTGFGELPGLQVRLEKILEGVGIGIDVGNFL